MAYKLSKCGGVKYNRDSFKEIDGVLTYRWNDTVESPILATHCGGQKFDGSIFKDVDGVITTADTETVDSIRTSKCSLKFDNNILTDSDGAIRTVVKYDIAPYRGDTFTYPELNGLRFAGWYQDVDYKTKVSSSTKTGEYYAKFVDDGLSCCACQIITDSSAYVDFPEEIDEGCCNVRFISTIDTLRYSAIGFKIKYRDKDVNYNSKDVNGRLVDCFNEDGSRVNAKSFSYDSTYFFSVVITNAPIDNVMDLTFVVTPYYKTQDGTMVYTKEFTFTPREVLEQGGKKQWILKR